MKLSIIIPYYEVYDLIIKLLDVLIPQIEEDIEVFIVDDGCNETRLNDYVYQEKYMDKWNNIHVWHTFNNSGTASVPRNLGLEFANGEYIAFIDADDMITEDYIKEIKSKMSSSPDIIYLSWKSKVHNIIMNGRPPKWNSAVWCRVYKREIIGNTKFREDLKIAEDWEFNTHIKANTRKCIKKQIYYYNIRKNSLVRSINK